MFFIRNVHSVLPSLCSKSDHPTTSSEELRDAITFHFFESKQNNKTIECFPRRCRTLSFSHPKQTV